MIETNALPETRPHPPTAEPSAAGPSAAKLTVALAYDGRMGPISLIQITNFLATIPTLGVYRFWATTRLRRYFWSSVTISGGRLEYNGTGWELFKGLIFVLLVTLPLAALYFFVSITLSVTNPTLSIVLTFAVLGTFLYLSYVGSYLRRRYILSRTQWRGIRGALYGSPWRFGFFAFKQFLIWLISLGIYGPWASMKLQERIWDNTTFGNQPFRFERKMGSLPQAWWFSVLGKALVFFLLYAFAKQNYPLVLLGGNPVFSRTTTIVIFGALFLFYIFCSAYYAAALQRAILNSIQFESVTLKSSLSAWRYFTIYLVMTLVSLIVVSVVSGVTFLIVYTYFGDVVTFERVMELLVANAETGQYELQIQLASAAFFGVIFFLIGFFLPMLFTHRLWKAIFATLDVEGGLSPTRLTQSTQERDGRGEGLATAFDMGGL